MGHSISQNLRKATTGLTLGEISDAAGRLLSEGNTKEFFESHTSTSFLAWFESVLQDRLLLAEKERIQKLHREK